MSTIKHAFTDPKADGGDATVVRPSNWNADHAVTYTKQSLSGAGTIDIASDVVILGAGTYAVTVPAATGSGKPIHVTMNGSGVITLNRSASDTIGGQTSLTLNGPGDWCVIIDQAAGQWGLEHDGAVPGILSVATAGGTTTLTNSSPGYIVFTGASTQTCVLPDATTLALSTSWHIDNESTAPVTVQSSGGTTLFVLIPKSALSTTLLTNSVAAGTWEIDYTAPASTSGTQTIATASVTTTLTTGSPRQIIFTGSQTQTVVLPNATTIPNVDWAYEIVNQSTQPITVQTNGGATLTIIPAYYDLTLNCTSIGSAAGTWQFLNATAVAAQTPSSPVSISSLQLFGHSYLDNANEGNSSTNILPNNNSNVGSILAAAMNIDPSCVVNHAVTGSQLTSPLRAGGVNVGGGFAKVLAEINKKQAPFPPYSRNGEAYLLCWGVNDTGNNSPANQTTLNARAADAMTTIISKCRAATVINGNDTGLGLAYTGTWAAAAAGAVDYTGGKGWATSTTGGVFTFTIPRMYRGQPICFSMVGYSSANALTVTWSGTAGVTGTTTLNSLGPNAQCIVPKRITGLTSANAGQTIIGTVALTSQTFILDAVWIEAVKPSPVLVCNQPRLPSRTVNIASGAGTTTGVNTTFTDASISFVSATDAGATLTETDAQGALTGNTNTVSSVTNTTTIVLGSNAASAKSNIKYTLARKFNGYPTNSWTNTDFTGATVASHANADNAVLAWNTAVITNVVTLFDSMVQIVDLDAAIGQDTTCPAGLYSWWDENSFAHPTVWGNHRFAMACWEAITKLQQPVTDTIGLGPFQNASAPAYRPAGYRRVIRDTAMSNTAGQLYLPDNAQIDVVANLYTCVAGDLFAYPFMITEATIYAMGCKLEQIGATGTSSVRVGLYDDMAGPGGTPSGYPQCLRIDGGLTSLTASASVQALGNFYRPLYPGLWWLAFGVATLNVASTLRTIFGPNPCLPSWNGVLNGVVRPIAWKVTGQTLTSNMPSTFPSGGALVGCAGGTFASASAAPLVSLMLNVF